MLRAISVFTCFLLTGCTHILVVQGTKVNVGGKETMHCIMHINQNEVTPDLEQKARDFCKAIERAPVK